MWKCCVSFSEPSFERCFVLCLTAAQQKSIKQTLPTAGSTRPVRPRVQQLPDDSGPNGRTEPEMNYAEAAESPLPLWALCSGRKELQDAEASRALWDFNTILVMVAQNVLLSFYQTKITFIFIISDRREG